MSPLTFNIIRQSTQVSTARRGTLAISQTNAGQNSSTEGNNSLCKDALATKRSMETPGCFMYSIRGSVPHLTPDTLRLQGFGGVCVSIENILQENQPAGFEKWSFNLSKYLNLQDFILLCDIRDTSRYVKTHFNSDRHVSMVTQQGVRQLTFEEYLKTIRVYEPDIIAAFADSISDLDQNELGKLVGPAPGPKRVKKSVDRSLKWLDQILKERQGIDAIAEERLKAESASKIRKLKQQLKKQQESGEGRDIEKEIEALELDSLKIEAMPTQKPWSNVSVFAPVVGSQDVNERIRSAEETAKREGVDGFVVDTHSLLGTKDDVLSLLKVSIDHLPKEKPRLVYGMQAPEDVLRSIALGADLFDASYPFLLTEDGKASLFRFGEQAKNDDKEIKRQRWINLWDDEHINKFVPILEGCGCYACKGGRHTRAYINHLLKTHEMLATVLLMSHNMHQYSEFFANVRQSIQEETFDRQSTSFIETYGSEPERSSEMHPAQAAVEASLARRGRFEDEEGEASAAKLLAEEAEKMKKKKDQLREDRRAKFREEGLKIQAEKRRARIESELKKNTD